jgi:hypothetical protein
MRLEQIEIFNHNAWRKSHPNSTKLEQNEAHTWVRKLVYATDRQQQTH